MTHKTMKARRNGKKTPIKKCMRKCRTRCRRKCRNYKKKRGGSAPPVIVL